MLSVDLMGPEVMSENCFTSFPSLHLRPLNFSRLLWCSLAESMVRTLWWCNASIVAFRRERLGSVKLLPQHLQPWDALFSDNEISPVISQMNADQDWTKGKSYVDEMSCHFQKLLFLGHWKLEIHLLGKWLLSRLLSGYPLCYLGGEIQ